MKPVLQRIAINGVLAALFLAMIGFFLGQVGTMFVVRSEVPTGANGPNPDEELLNALQYRVPLMLAFWGFVFVAVGEVLLHLWRSRKPAPAPAPAQQHPTEQLLQELLAKAEAEEKARADAQAGGTRHREAGGESVELPAPGKGTGHRASGGESREMIQVPDPESPKKE